MFNLAGVMRWVLMSEQPTSPQEPSGGSVRYPPPPYAAALLVDDPPRIGDYWLDARLDARPSGVAYLAHADNGRPVMLLVLSQGAANDAAARDRLAGEVNKMHVDTVVARGGQGQDEGRLADKFRGEADDPIGPDEEPLVPWVALAWDGSVSAVAEADRVLRSVDLSTTPQIGDPTGPDYRLHWVDDTRPGRWRLWPLQWPARKDRAGWMTIAVSWLLMLLFTALALLIVVLIFQNTPPESPQPPVPTDQQSQSSNQSPQSPQSSDSSPEPSSASPSESSASPSPSESSGSASAPSQTPSGSGSPTRTSSMEVSGTGTATAPNSQTPNPKL